MLSVVSALLCLLALSPSSETSVYIQTAQDLLLGRESSPIWKEHIHGGSVPELISLELIILAQWLLLFVWAACGSRTVPWLLDLSGITSGQLGACLHVAMEMLPLCFSSVSPLEMDGIESTWKQSSVPADPQRGVEPAARAHRGGKRSCLCRETVGIQGGEQQGWLQVLL